jgi:ankyrin repeat protein
MTKPNVAFAALVVVFFLVAAAGAQIAPTQSEIGAYGRLHAAAASGDLTALRATLRSNPDLNARDSAGRTPVLVAAHLRQRAVMRELAKAGADMRAQDNQRYDAITIAAVNDDVETLRLAIELGSDPRAITSPWNGTALIAAAHLGHAEVVRALIAARAPLDHVNNLGWTAVMEAIVLGDGGRRHQDTLKALVDAGADIRIADRQGVTPLEQARHRGFTEMVTILSR